MQIILSKSKVYDTLYWYNKPHKQLAAMWLLHITYDVIWVISNQSTQGISNTHLLQCGTSQRIDGCSYLQMT